MDADTPAVEKAREYILSRLHRGGWCTGERLPALRQLAGMARVSYVSMWKAVRSLADSGLLTAVKGSGITAGGKLAHGYGPVARATPKRWERIARQIEHDVFQGVLHTREFLPSQKELETLYGADYRTVRKALVELEAQRVLERRRRNYRIVRSDKPFSDDVILFCTPFSLSEASARSFATFSLYEFVRFLESECSRRNLRLVPVCSADKGRAFRKTVEALPVLGCIIHEPEPGILSETFSFLDTPIMVFDNISGFRLGSTAEFRAHAKSYSFQIDEKSVGAGMARFLLRMGHRKAAYISPFEFYGFSENRFAGMVDAFQAAGVGDGLTVARSERGAEADAWPRGPDDPRLSRKVLETPLNVRDAGILDRLRSPAVPARGVDAPSTYRKELSKALAPVFDRTLKESDATVWVCANDAVAILALGFLQGKGIAVPGGISVAGFDNSEDASYTNLTSYSFDIPGIALDMLDRILRPANSRSGRPSERIIMTTGMVIQRGTVGRVESRAP